MIITEKYKSGIKTVKTGCIYEKLPSKTNFIRTKIDTIKKANTPKGINILTKQRLQDTEDVEQLILI